MSKHGYFICILCASMALHGCAATNSDQSLSQNAAQNISEIDAPELEVALGEARLLENLNGAQKFAGQVIGFNEFSGLVGYSTEVGYAVVISGNASSGNEIAEAGEMLLMPTYGNQPTVERYDAQSFAESQYAQDIMQSENLNASLDQIIAQQSSGIFWGRLRRTSFNVAAPGSAEHELARRSVVGSGIVHDIRFSGVSDPAHIEETVVEKFRTAMMRGDLETVSSLLSPAAFGATDIRGGAGGARDILARHIMSKENWKTYLASGSFERTQAPSIWSMNTGYGRILLETEPVNDFVYVKNIRRERSS